MKHSNHKNRTVLFVDDEISILNTLKRLLRNEEYNLLTASSAQEALELLSHKAVDLVISDMRMPHISGTEFLEQVKDQYPTINRMIMSGYADLESVVSAVNLGNITQFITKPWDNDALKKMVLSHLTMTPGANNEFYEESTQVKNLKQIICEQQKVIEDLHKQLEEFTDKKV